MTGLHAALHAVSTMRSRTLRSRPALVASHAPAAWVTPHTDQAQAMTGGHCHWGAECPQG